MREVERVRESVERVLREREKEGDEDKRRATTGTSIRFKPRTEKE